MNFDVIATEPFGRNLKKLIKKYPSLREDLIEVFQTLETHPTTGIPIGHDCYKIRIAISSKGKGKSGGGRLITLVRIQNKRVFLLALYDKSEVESLTDSALKKLIQHIHQV
jgi:mRNA-degrading endonuclease RelE of RelBE toxin-antitoxin system